MADSGQRKQYGRHGSSYVGEYFVWFLTVLPGTGQPGGEAPLDADRSRAAADIASPPRAVTRVSDVSQLCANDRATCRLRAAWHFVSFPDSPLLPPVSVSVPDLRATDYDGRTTREFANHGGGRRNEKGDGLCERERGVGKGGRVTSHSIPSWKTKRPWTAHSRLHRSWLSGDVMSGDRTEIVETCIERASRRVEVIVLA